MKTFSLAAILATLTFFRATAQVGVEITTEQEQFLPGEAVPVAVKITNRSGQPIHLGATPDWLTFNVESVDSFVVIKKGEAPLMGEFDLESSQMGTKRADLQPYFEIVKPGRYKVIATLRIKDWSVAMTSPPKYFDVVNGADLWSQDFGLPPAAGETNAVPEVRKFTLIEANYLRSQLRLYVRVSDPTISRVFKISPLGALVSFSHPEAQVDRTSNLHVLWQSGAQSFIYCLISTDGVVLRRDIYDYVTTRPRLDVNGQGEVVVVGGVRRIHPADYSDVKLPTELPASRPSQP